MKCTKLEGVAGIVMLAITLASMTGAGWMYHRMRTLERLIEKPAAVARSDKPATNSVQPRAAEAEVERFAEPPPPQPKDLSPRVKYVHRGRYLPPVGDRKCLIESVNMSAIEGEICRVVPANVVQLMAREEDKYSGYWPGGDVDSWQTSELSGEPETFTIPCANKLNVVETNAVSIALQDGGPTNGIFLVNVSNEYRLVCISDIGLSVRTNKLGIGVWATSLTQGTPVSNAEVAVYSSANLRIFEGRTDDKGWCTPHRIAKGDPFAVVVSSESGDDSTFLALSYGSCVDENYKDGARCDYEAPNECLGYLWTERGIYRHDERIFCNLILRTGERVAPKPFPVVLELLDPNGRVYSSVTRTSDALGTLTYTNFVVGADQPSGKWELRARMPGKSGPVLDWRVVSIEEFAPPTVRVQVEPKESASATNFSFRITGEHLFGGAASFLSCSGAIVFEDIPFAPAAWKGYHFGNEDLGLKPNFRRLKRTQLDSTGCASFVAPLLKESGRPKAMVRATAQGIVTEDGGRTATARASAALHYYPYYIGSTLSSWIKTPLDGQLQVPLACVSPQGSRETQPHALMLKLERIESVYAYHQQYGRTTWSAERVATPIFALTNLVTKTDGDTVVSIPLKRSGDYKLIVTDEVTQSSYAHTFYLSEYGDEYVRASLSNPTALTLQPDKALYRVGDVPRLLVKSPFAGFAMISVQRDQERYTEIVSLTNATSEIELRPLERADAPNLDVYISVIQSVRASERHLAARAHGQTTLRVRPAEEEIPVSLNTSIAWPLKADGARVQVEVKAPGAEKVTVTLVDEGINLLTGEKTPDPIEVLSEVRGAEHPLFDLFGMILPVVGEGLKASGLKTGGGAGAGMLGRVSPVGTRRFKPLALWSAELPVKDGAVETTFDLPPFVGEVRVTAVVCSEIATGAASVQQKVAPKLVMQPDAPRFVAPGDAFDVCLPLHNTSGEPGEVAWSVADQRGTLTLAAKAATNLFLRLTAPETPGHLALVYEATGLGERHKETIELPVRPAVAWVETSGVRKRIPGEPTLKPTLSPFEKYTEREYDSPLGEYEAALRWLAEYRYGCLEQTCSRVFPLICAGGILNGVVTNSADAVNRGVARVESMIRANDFTMWPDCDYAPWNQEVSIYAAHFLFAAEKAGYALRPRARERVERFLSKWHLSTNACVSAYATYVLALAGQADKDRMCRLYDHRAELNAVSRARLALAFVEVHDLTRARTLLQEAYEPQDMTEAAFQLMARVAVDPKDPLALKLVAWLNDKRDRAKFCWGTTDSNAHALMAIGSYFQTNPPQKGERFVTWRKLTLPKLTEIKAENAGLFLSRKFLKSDGSDADLTHLVCGDLLTAELTITSAVTRVVNDLVIEDLFPGCFDPVMHDLSDQETPPWVMRKDVRDDRMLIFSKRFTLETNDVARISYPVRVTSAGSYVLPGTSVEGMYNPELHARLAPGRIVVQH